MFCVVYLKDEVNRFSRSLRTNSAAEQRRSLYNSELIKSHNILESVRCKARQGAGIF